MGAEREPPAAVAAADCDVLALQEVDHPDDLRAALRRLGYDSEFAQRPNGRQDGCMTAWRASRFGRVWPARASVGTSSSSSSMSSSSFSRGVEVVDFNRLVEVQGGRAPAHNLALVVLLVDRHMRPSSRRREAIPAAATATSAAAAAQQHGWCWRTRICMEPHQADEARAGVPARRRRACQRVSDASLSKKDEEPTTFV